MFFNNFSVFREILEGKKPKNRIHYTIHLLFILKIFDSYENLIFKINILCHSHPNVAGGLWVMS